MSVSSVFFDYFPLGKNAKKVKANHGAATWGRGGAHIEVHRIFSGGRAKGEAHRETLRLSVCSHLPAAKLSSFGKTSVLSLSQHPLARHIPSSPSASP